jgi:hypothetical protein
LKSTETAARVCAAVAPHFELKMRKRYLNGLERAF